MRWSLTRRHEIEISIWSSRFITRSRVARPGVERDELFGVGGSRGAEAQRCRKTRFEALGGTSSDEKTLSAVLESEKWTSVAKGPLCRLCEITKSSGIDDWFWTTKERLK